MLTVQQIEALLQFLDRTPMEGREVPMFVNITNTLHQSRTDQLAAAQKQAIDAAVAEANKAEADKADKPKK